MTEIALGLPSAPGTYGLLLHRSMDGTIEIGKLGVFDFPVGYYLYIGSALGPAGLAGRLRRHLSRDKQIHWHVDYLRQEATIIELWVGEDAVRREHIWATVAKQLPGADQLATGFGSSDCSCSSHLSYFLEKPDFYQFREDQSKQQQSIEKGKMRLIRL